MQKIFRILFILAVCYHGFFYVSAFKTHTLDAWYENISPGQDFFQIPIAAHAVLHGGTFQGSVPDGIAPYICCGANSNVYHPLFTLLVGVPLQLFSPWTAYSVWVFMHAMITIMTVLYLWHHNRNNPVLYLALSIYLVVSYHYYEIKMAQYHFLVVFFTMLFLHDAEKYGDTIRAGFWLFLSLLVKPFGLLFLIPLLLYKRWKTVLVGYGLFILVTIPTLIQPENRYYILNVINVSKSIVIIYNIYAVAYFLPFFLPYLQRVTYVSAFCLVLYQLIKKPPLFVVLACWTCFQLLFYSMVFPYYYTVIAVIFALSFLFGYLRVHIRSILISLLFILPTPALYFHLRGSPAILPTNEFLFLGVWSSVTVIFLLSELLRVLGRGSTVTIHNSPRR